MVGLPLAPPIGGAVYQSAFIIGRDLEKRLRNHSDEILTRVIIPDLSPEVCLTKYARFAYNVIGVHMCIVHILVHYDSKSMVLAISQL